MAEEQADDIQPEAAGTEEAPKTIPFDQYQKLQRKLSAEQAKQRELAVSRLDLDDIRGEVSSLSESLGLLLKSSRSAYDDETGAEYEQYTKKTEYQRAGRAARREISTLMLEAEVEWSDPQLEEVRVAYQAGRFGDAVANAQRVLGRAASEKDIEERVETLVRDRLRERGLTVDDGTSAGVTSGIPTDAAELRQRLKDPAWFKEHKAEVMQAMKQGRVR